MNRRLITKIITFVVAGLCLYSCNSDDSGYFTIDDPSTQSLEVTSFSISRNANIIENLDSVFFSIDLANFRIYNADSLPVGTQLKKLVLNIETATVSKAQIKFKNEYDRDTIVDYLTNPSDSINFNNGPVYLQLDSYDGKVNCNYLIQVNIHKNKPDSLYWDRNDYQVLPGGFSYPRYQKTVKFNDMYYCLAATRTLSALTYCENPYDKEWTSVDVEFPENMDVNSFTASGDALYLIADGMLYKSADRGATWASTGAEMTYLYGGYMNSVIGVKEVDGKYYHASYPETTEVEVPENCPVSGTSSLLTFSSEWSAQPMVLFQGGVTASGSLSGATWAFDGNSWSEISAKPLPAWEGGMLFPYYTMTYNSQWILTMKDVLVATGGRLEDGTISTDFYISYDRGIHWESAPQYYDYPTNYSEQITPRWGAQAFVVDKTIGTEKSRVVAPIVEWECPYIYVFGGFDQYDNLGGIRRGYMNYFTFQPIY